MPDPLQPAPQNATVIPLDVQNTGTGTGQAQATVDTSFKIPEQFASKGWKTPDEFFKSYGEIEQARSRELNQLNEYVEYFKSIAPFASDIDAFVAEKMAALTGKAQDKPGKIPVEIDQRLKAQEEWQARQEAEQVNLAKSTASDQFEKDHPEHEQYRGRIIELLKSGVVQSSNPKDVRANTVAFEAALRIAKQEVADKAEQAKRAAAVHGHPGDLSGGGAVDFSNLNKVRDGLRAEA